MLRLDSPLPVLATSVLLTAVLGGCGDGHLESLTDVGLPGPGASGPGLASRNYEAVPIDDLEDGDEEIIPQGGRIGWWYTYNDDSPGNQRFEITRLRSQERASAFVAHHIGAGFQIWGAGLGFSLAPDLEFYDASQFVGVTFWAKTSNPVGMNARFNLTNRHTLDFGGICGQQGLCFDHYGLDVWVTDEWQPYTVFFEDMEPRGWGQPTTYFDATALHDVQFLLGEEGEDFELWLDDVAFIAPR